MDEAELEARLRRIEARLTTLEALEGMHDNPTPLPTPAKVQPGGVIGITYHQVAGAFAKRYRQARQLEWYSGPHVQSMIDIADAINAQNGDARALGKVALDNFFADEFAAKAGFPPGLLSKQFFRYLKPPEEDGKPDRTVQRLKAEEAQRRHEEAKRQAEAAHAREVAQRAAEGPQRAKAHLTAVKDILEGE